MGSVKAKKPRKPSQAQLDRIFDEETALIKADLAAYIIKQWGMRCRGIKIPTRLTKENKSCPTCRMWALYDSFEEYTDV